MANTKISALPANVSPLWSEELVYAYNNSNGKMTLNTMKTFIQPDLSWYATTSDLSTWLSWKQDTLVSGTNIKTINNTSLLWSWNITIQWGWWQTQYDYSAMQWPCATWFHVPYEDEWTELYTMWTTISAFSSWTNFATYLKLPLWWIRNQSDAAVDKQWVQWRYWSATSYSDSAWGLFFGTWWVNISQYHKAYWYMLRWFKDNPVKPNSSWTTLFDWSSTAVWAWIFYNPYDWLISISADWEKWITIADKNVWATAVWEYWDTPSETNAWTYFQWWNNYWFAYTWAVTTSGTQVDASSYWPWNYYSSSTFITRSTSPYDWSSVNNDNLWWAVTWPQQVTPDWVTELTANANIWELSEWTYETTYDLYYKSWKKLKTSSWTAKQRIVVIEESTWIMWFFAFNVWHYNTTYTSRAYFWYSVSSAVWDVVTLANFDAAFEMYIPSTWAWFKMIWENDCITNISDSITWSNTLEVASWVVLYEWVQYNNIITSWTSYTITIDWTSVTNPLNITLPSSSSKPCIITSIATDSTHAIITWCTIWN